MTTASDVFSLGVILYELLTNEKPFHFEGKSLDEIIRTVTIGEPTLPSRAVLDSPAAGRRRQLRGDLDNITLRALQKDPPRRYQSVADLANDIERHLGNLPIVARPNTLSYRASRFYQRNRIAVSAMAFIMVALAVGLAVALWQNTRARRENAKAEAVNAFLQKMLNSENAQKGAGSAKGYQTTMDDILAEAEKRLDGAELSEQPGVRAELRQVVGSGYLDIGNYDAAERNLRQGLAEETRIYGPGSPKLLKTEFTLAALFLARADYENAENIFGQRFSLLRDEFKQGRIAPEFFTTRLADYALLRRARGDSIQAEALLRESLATGSHGVPSLRTEMSRGFLTLILLDQGKFAEAEGFQQEVVTRFRNQTNNETPEFCGALTLLGSILMEKGELNGAEANLREGEKLYRKLLGPNHTAIYDNLRLQAQVSYLAGKYTESYATISQVLEHYRQNSNPKYISFATALTVQGLALNKLGRSDEAERVLRQALKLREENLPRQHFMTALTRGALGECLTIQKHYEEAEQLLVASYDDLKASQGEQNPRTILARQRLVRLYEAWGKADIAKRFGDL